MGKHQRVVVRHIRILGVHVSYTCLAAMNLKAMLLYITALNSNQLESHIRVAAFVPVFGIQVRCLDQSNTQSQSTSKTFSSISTVGVCFQGLQRLIRYTESIRDLNTFQVTISLMSDSLIQMFRDL